MFQALRDRLRCTEIWVIGADHWRDPAEDLPAKFDNHRLEHYARLRQPWIRRCSSAICVANWKKR